MEIGFWNKFSYISIWISNLVYLNLLWLAFTVFGGVLFGFFPATIAMLSVIKKLLFEKNEFNVGREFIFYYKKEFRMGNKTFLPFILAFLLVIVDIQFFVSYQIVYKEIFITVFYILLFLVGLSLLYSMGLYIITPLRGKKLIKDATNLIFFYPFQNLYLLTLLCLVLLIMFRINGFFLFFSGTIFSVFYWLSIKKILKRYIDKKD